MRQKHYIAGLYYRLSQEDERQGESVSIDNQRAILRKYAEERGFEIHDEYIDDGISGTTFQRPEVQRLLDDAKTAFRGLPFKDRKCNGFWTTPRRELSIPSS